MRARNMRARDAVRRTPRSQRTHDALGQLTAQLKLGKFLAARREELRLSQGEVVERAGWSQGFYSELERGLNSSDDIRGWGCVADALQLNRRRVIELVWEARGRLSLPLPRKGDRRRD